MAEPKVIDLQGPPPDGDWPVGRRAEPGELCTCGRQAITVYESRDRGPVGHCGLSNGGAPADGWCPFCGNELRHDAAGVDGPIVQGERCPLYRLRLDDPVPDQ